MIITLGVFYILSMIYLFIRVLYALNMLERSIKRWVDASGRPKPLRYQAREGES
jgi:hypothetical protein